MEVEQIKLQYWVGSPFNPRDVLPNMDEITASIKEKETLEPLMVHDLKDENVEIIDGHLEAGNAIEL